MDSKYTAISGTAAELKKINNLKRKNPSEIFNVNVKKIKLYNKLNHSVNKPNGVSNTNNIQVNNVKEKSESLLDARKQLPVYMVRGRLLEEIKKNDTMILIGETGSGKTTQIPQLIHEQRLEGAGAIAVTQPRRVAAITIAMRVAAEMSCDIGTIVG